MSITMTGLEQVAAFRRAAAVLDDQASGPGCQSHGRPEPGEDDAEVAGWPNPPLSGPGVPGTFPGPGRVIPNGIDRPVLIK